MGFLCCISIVMILAGVTSDVSSSAVTFSSYNPRVANSPRILLPTEEVLQSRATSEHFQITGRFCITPASAEREFYWRQNWLRPQIS